MINRSTVSYCTVLLAACMLPIPVRTGVPYVFTSYGLLNCKRCVPVLYDEDDEVEEMAAYAGVSLAEEPQLRKVVEGMVLAPLPPGWTEDEDTAGHSPWSIYEITQYKVILVLDLSDHITYTIPI